MKSLKLTHPMQGLLWAGILAAALPAAAQQAPPTARELLITAGKSLVVNSNNTIERVATGYGDVAEARVISPKEVLLNGKTPGETSLIIWQQGGNMLFFDVIVRANTSAARSKLDDLQKQLQAELPGQNVTATMQGDVVYLRGNVKDLLSSDRAITLATAVSPKVVNLLYVDVPPTDTQILLKVQFATIDRSREVDLGLNLFSTGAGNILGRATTGQFPGPSPSTTVGNGNVTLTDALNLFMMAPGLNFGATIKALESKGLAEILAEPNVLAINGKPASFLSGGEFPYPILQGGGGGIGTVTVAFREFGVRINFLPVITPRGTIRLLVAPEVSALDFTDGLTVSGFTVPALTSRKMSTEIELKDGQSFAIGGLLDRRLSETLEKIPLLGSIPLLGKLFQSRVLTKQNNELLVVITPEIVHPVQQGQPVPQLTFPAALPGDGKVPQTPGPNVTGTETATKGEQIPVEELLRRMKLEDDMKLPQAPTFSTWPNGLGMQAPTLSPATPPGGAPAAPIKQQ